MNLPARVGDGDEDLVAQDDGGGGEGAAPGLRGDDMSRLEVVVEAELAGVVLEDEEHLLPAPDDRSRVRLVEELTSLLRGAVGGAMKQR
jgi:hypothetical protein